MPMAPDDQNLDCGWKIENPEHTIIYDQAKPFLQTRFNALHVRISYDFATALLNDVGGDPMVVIPAVEPEIKTVKLPDLSPLLFRAERTFSVISIMSVSPFVFT